MCVRRSPTLLRRVRVLTGARALLRSGRRVVSRWRCRLRRCPSRGRCTTWRWRWRCWLREMIMRLRIWRSLCSWVSWRSTGGFGRCVGCCLRWWRLGRRVSLMRWCRWAMLPRRDWCRGSRWVGRVICGRCSPGSRERSCWTRWVRGSRSGRWWRGRICVMWWVRTRRGMRWRLLLRGRIICC